MAFKKPRSFPVGTKVYFCLFSKNYPHSKLQERKLEYMKATGIVRRIDDLGRVVIPKEIRRTMRIREGDPLEIFVSNEGEVIFKKYSPISELGSIAAQYCEVLFRTAGYPVLITDRDHVVAVSGISRREVLERRVSPGLEEHIESRKNYTAGEGRQPLQPIEGVAYYALVQYPIISSGDVCGSVMFLQNKENEYPSEAEQKLIAAAESYLGKQMEL